MIGYRARMSTSSSSLGRQYASRLETCDDAQPFVMAVPLETTGGDCSIKATPVPSVVVYSPEDQFASTGHYDLDFGPTPDRATLNSRCSFGSLQKSSRISSAASDVPKTNTRPSGW